MSIPSYAPLVFLALSEDNGRFIDSLHTATCDITTEACIPATVRGVACIRAKANGVISGQEVAEFVFSTLDPSVEYESLVQDGRHVRSGDVISRIKGPLRSILVGERVALNFLQRLSGVATRTRAVVESILPLTTKILDTRKTTPGFRLLEKKAIQDGGGVNHRMGLFDEFLIKDNHIDALGGDFVKAINNCRAFKPEAKLKVEVRTREELVLAMSANPDGILLDNFAPEELIELVPFARSLSNSTIRLEVSGGITDRNVLEYAKTGVDEISLGFLTHSVSSLDLSLQYER